MSLPDSPAGYFAVDGSNMYRQEGAAVCTLGNPCYIYFGGSLVFGLLMYAFETYLSTRQHGNFSLKSIPKALENILAVVDKESLRKKAAAKAEEEADGDVAKEEEESSAEKDTDEKKGAEEEEAPIEPGKLLETTQAKFVKSQDYGRDKSTFGMVSGVWDQLLGFPMMCLGYEAWLWDISYSLGHTHFGLSKTDEIYISWIFLTISTLVSTALSCPWSLYHTFVIEEKHGFNKQTIGLWISDQLKTLALSAVIGLPFIAAFIWLIKWGGPLFYWYVWAFMFVFQILMMTIYPVYIAPLFNKYDKLPEGALRDQIEDLAKELQFPLTKLFVMDGSKRSSHSNAFMYGFFNNKRIVLFDTLIKNCTIKEVVGVLGHEMGHWKMGHTIQGLVIAQVYMLAMFYFFGLCMNTAALFNSFGFAIDPATGTGPVVIGVTLFLSTVWAPVDKLLNFILTWNTRRNEFQADEFAVNLGYVSSLQSGLTKISLKSLGNMVPDPWYSTYHYSHPPLVERLIAMQEKGKLVKKKRD